MLYEKDIIKQVTFTTEDSTFHAFSKAVTSNLFGLQHMQDPNKDKYDFLVCLDNDVIVTPGWDEKIKAAWDDVIKLKMSNIKIIGQLPGGIKGKTYLKNKIGGFNAATGKLGGSGFWTFKPNFFKEVGLLDISLLVGQDKKHDQLYWRLLEKASSGKDYILGLEDKLAIHAGGKWAGSICNTLTSNHHNKARFNLIKFEHLEKKIDDLSFSDFYNLIINDTKLLDNW